MFSDIDANKVAMSAIELLKVGMKYQVSKEVLQTLINLYNSQMMKGGSSCMTMKVMKGGGMKGGKARDKIMELQDKKIILEEQLVKSKKPLEREAIMKKIMGLDGLMDKIIMKGGSCGKGHGKMKGGAMKDMKVLESSAMNLLKLAMGYELSKRVLSEIEKLLKKNGYKKME